MKIIKYVKKNKNEYTIYLDNNTTITLYDDTILKYELLIKKEIIDIDPLINYNNSLKDYYNILSILNKKRKTIKEVEDLLKESKYKKDIINKLISNNYLNDYTYTENYINIKINTTLDGYNKIYNNLLSLGVDKDIISKYLDNIDNIIWINRIEKTIKKHPNKNSNTIYKNKMKYLLISMGYNTNDINTILDKINNNDYSNLEKDYLKIKKQLERKYSNNILITNIKKKLYNKGYKIEDIDNVIKNDIN